MTVRKSWIVSILIIVGSVFAFKYISKGKERIKKSNNSVEKVAMYKVVKNEQLPLIVEASGQLKSKHTFDMYSEVTGVLKASGKEFRTGNKFRKGELMIQIEDSEVKAQLYSQRSDFQNLITSLLPDIKIEFPSEFTKWEDYLTSFEIERSIKVLPKLSSKKEKYFVSGKKVFTQYYSIKNLEARYAKYNLRAPFNGIVTETSLKPGGLVRSGQKMGVFSNMDTFELEVSVKASDSEYVKIGNHVNISSSDKKQSWDGKVVRINGAIDLNSQTVSVFVETKGKGLKAGMYLDVEMESTPLDHATLISRNILHNNTFVYLVKDSTLVEFEINPVKFNEKSVMVNNLHEGDLLVQRNISGSFPGMKVNPKQVK
ncbi:MAG: efflux RND transporter periplasmic adaptor subunit [Flavobacteriales bacterium]|nr:efflux RND transporter periplasmic adaptor subunit [Flavobacteriales bacterium]